LTIDHSRLTVHDSRYIILFDGVCNLCNSSVDFVLKRDKKKRFVFGSLQGQAGQAYLQRVQLPVSDFNSFVLVENDQVYTRSTAALRVLKHLGGGWLLLYGFIIIPAFIRDAVYKWIARNRYKWFGKRDTCRLPRPEEKAQFLD
jgi:predicted DCC family thiol-disulfide oxidoreductase YuxK